MLQAAIGLTKSKSRSKSDGGANDELELVLHCQNGDRDAQHRLYQHYKDTVFSIAFRMTNNQQEAEDLAQMAFLRIFKKVGTFRGDSALSSWIYRLTVNVCINHCHKEKKRKSILTNELAGLHQENHRALKREPGEQPPKFRPFLEKAIRALPAGYRMIFVLYDIEGYRHREIAQMMNISEGTSKSQLHKARKELKQNLEPYRAMYQSLS